jgi:DNA-binding response OmpR family regulator
MTGKTRILIVDDNRQIQALLTELLGVTGHVTRTASSCEEARALVDRESFSCALIDLGLPDGNGLDLLPYIREKHPLLVPIILTGDGRAETIIETMRAGAFDFLIKPFVSASLQAAVNRAQEHHDVLRERDELVQLLSDEREQLKVRVEEATADLRQYANHCELVSARLHSLVRLTQVAANLYTDETFFRSIIEELEKYIPLHCVALDSATGHKFLAAWRNGGDEIHVIAVDDVDLPANNGRFEAGPEDRLRQLVERHAQLDTPGAAVYVYPQSYWGKAACTVAFFLDDTFAVDADCDQFLSMCAHFLGFEWQDARLSHHATQQASLGNIALEISKGLIQGLTAIRTTADFVSETPISDEAAEGLKLIRDNVESLHNQIKDFRQLSMPHKESVETVQLSEYIDQAIDVLARALQNRDITITRDYDQDCECVLLNGTSLARAFLDLIAAAVRTVANGGEIALAVTGMEPNHILVQIRHEAVNGELFGVPRNSGEGEVPILIESHPQFILALRTIQSCGGKLLLKYEDETHRAFDIILPRNPLRTSRPAEVNT